MRYHLGFWHHNNSDDPVWMLSEVDENKNVIRQVERYWNGRIVRRSASEEGIVSLIDVAFEEDLLSTEEGEFSNFVLTKEEFERIWCDDNT